ncbi:ubiquinol oxidase subunit II [Paenibacillus melissococcoides]|uniref:Quinol oxidase subunit 2 n=1 Tax=Paenibacillus melissococcoides TaxID=2912268 RepID=A0ABN8U9T7_9BACL|nr:MULTISPECIES: ubiquinol oxidase subunit II [Paenibacillus]MEB9894544.1 ubiquinol oxidase subunit II [Bacillus cereus]CAH8246659.1 ubiquinol oxidase subunit II [Paenibacillus melissococcoides]CAH8715370.1 ubiquinol oxidase subunit II [Paenibacillus melissococcoides]CAH8716329.1 ubiquinol oxidase subunit II [Paenibacillus melissococcoides]GIO80034.1 ubiquinol oxidase subunit 2 [Paenibacillus dendritiformis]
MKRSNAFRWLAFLSMLASLLLLTTGCAEHIIVLDPKGPIAEQQRDLMVISTVLASIVIVPVLILTAIIVWRYRDKEGRTAKYAPEWEHNTKLEVIWWGIPIVVIAVLGIITVQSTYALEPSKPLESDRKALTIQATSLDWKWLFQYPEQGIATVNTIKIPEDVPIRFEITADSPMNSFWIPQLGGQMYAMSGMAMTLYLQADEPGQYWGSGANFTGKDFAKMHFDVEAASQEEFDQWVSEVKAASPALTLEGYKQLAEPAASDVKTFSSFPEGLFYMTVTKYASSHNHGLSWEDIQNIKIQE